MEASELILNPDGSVYHLHLLPEDIGQTIILVGDPDRVPLVSRHFDHIEIRKQKREFITHTGRLGLKRITVLSTGIGTDNIDIVMNELDALVNIDLRERQIKEKLTSLNVFRIGTSGSIHPDAEIDSIIISALSVGTDALGLYYPVEKVNHPLLPAWAYLTRRFGFDLKSFHAPYTEGITLTCPGFYGPQRRMLRLSNSYSIPIDGLHTSSIDGFPFTNLEMETSAIYLLAEQLGHKPMSFNTILANRLKGAFSMDPHASVESLIKAVLEFISDSTEC
jgi:uridine phosphorylase